jgi:hypothetical protein
MNKIPFFLLVFTLLTACADTAQAQNPAAIAQDVAAIETATMEAPTAIPPTAEPTVDIVALDAALKQREAELQDAINQKLAAQAAALDAKANEQAAGVAVAQITQAAEQLQATSIAEANIATATARPAYQTQTAFIVAATLTGQENMEAILKQQTDFTRAQTEAKTASTRLWIQIGMLVIAAFLVYALLRMAHNNELEPVEFVGVAEALQDEKLPTRVSAYPADLDIRIFIQNKFTIPELQKIAVGLRDGKPFTHDSFTPSENGLSEPKFTNLQYLLVKYGRAEWNDETHKGGVTLTSAGVAFFADLLKETTSPPKQEAPETTSPDGYLPIDTQIFPAQ